MLARSILVGTALVVAVSAQAATTTLSQFMKPQATAAFDINQVSAQNKTNWCLGQRNTCRQICDSGNGMGTAANTCVDATLIWSCSCRNGTAPDITSFEQTVPYQECLETFAQCIAASNDDRDVQDVCKANKVCGYRDASLLASGNGDSTTTTATRPTTATGTGPSQTSTAPTSTGAAAYYSQSAGTGVLASLFMAAFALVL